MHAVEDIGAVVEWLTKRCPSQADAKSNLAVLRNRNDMTDLFRTIVPRGVTTCAGMTAHTVILAQARVGFLTGGRKQSFLDLAQAVQMEEAYARATPGRRIACIVSQLICSLIENRWERAHPDLNQGPAHLQSAALTTELCTPAILSG